LAEVTLYTRWRFTVLLLALLLLMVLHPFFRGGTAWFAPLYGLLLALVYLGALLALFRSKRSRIAALVLGIPAMAGALTHPFVPTMPPALESLLDDAVPAVFLGYTVVTILKAILEAEVSTDSINGAFGGYLLLGVAFGHLYCLVEAARPGSFLVQGQVAAFPPGEGNRHSPLTYFSLITLTTVGYGDVTPASPPARSLACLEAVAGQFYIAVVISTLIGLRVSAAIREREPRRPADSGSG
jgi:hypothetical protein